MSVLVYTVGKWKITFVGDRYICNNRHFVFNPVGNYIDYPSLAERPVFTLFKSKVLAPD